MATGIAVECMGGSLATLRYLAQTWPVVSPEESEAITGAWRAKVQRSPRDWELHLYEVADAVGENWVGLLGRVMGGGGEQPPCAPLPERVWFAELRKLEFIGWTSEERIAWVPSAAQIIELEARPGATEGGWYIERMAPQWFALSKNWIAESAGGLAGGLANFVGEVFGKAALAFLQTVGPWALVLLGAWLAVKVVT